MTLLPLLLACAGGGNTLFAVADEPAGDNCANGGTRVDYGLDDDGDEALSDAEIDGSYFSCNGTDGADGDDAANLVLISSEVTLEAGYGCDHGYESWTVGVDDGRTGGTAEDGVIQDGEILEQFTTCADEDLDADGSKNLSDNCPETANEDQADEDLDGLGDVCDDASSPVDVYGISRGSDGPSTLYKLDLVANTATEIGNTGYELNYIAHNPKNGKLYGWTRRYDDNCSDCLLELNPSTAQATVVQQFDEGNARVNSFDFLSDGSGVGFSKNWDYWVALNTDGTTERLDGLDTEDMEYIYGWGHGMCVDDEDMIHWVNGNGAVAKVDPADGSFEVMGSLRWDSEWGDRDILSDEGGDYYYGVRGDCLPDALLYVGVDNNYGSFPASIVTVQLSKDGAPDVTRVVESPVQNLHAVAIVP